VNRARPLAPAERAALTADYTALVGLSQSTSGRVRPRNSQIDSIVNLIPPKPETGWSNTQVTK